MHLPKGQIISEAFFFGFNSFRETKLLLKFFQKTNETFFKICPSYKGNSFPVCVLEKLRKKKRCFWNYMTFSPTEDVCFTLCGAVTCLCWGPKTIFLSCPSTGALLPMQLLYDRFVIVLLQQHGILLQKLFWPTVKKKFWNSRLKAKIFFKTYEITRTIKQ